MKLIFTFSMVTILLVIGISAKSQTYNQVWADEFNGSVSNKWAFVTGGGGYGNNELQNYQRANATIVNNALQITAKKENVGGNAYTSAKLLTQGLISWKYGKVEASIKAPSTQGLWPAFWMLGDNISSVGWPSCGEIDIMEQVNTSTTNYGTIHWNNNGHVSYGGNVNTSAGVFHNYSITWTPSMITWFVDGVQYHQANIANGVNNTGCFQNNFFVILNLAVGGDWPGNTIGTLPANFVIDYVRVSQLGTAPVTTTIQAENYNNMFGVQKENTTDVGGGQNVGYIDANDWMVYDNINIPTAGTYTLEYRVASASGGGQIQFEKAGGSAVYGSVPVQSTGGWQNWTTVKHTVSLSAGVQSFAIKALSGGFNINWFAITSGIKAAKVENEIESNESVVVYPNPSIDGNFNIALSNFATDQNVDISVNDLSGKTVFANKTSLNEGETIVRVDNSSDLANGIYIVTIKSSTQTIKRKVLINR